ncbi:MAG: hypothetical protein PHR51_02610 [Patescibacteria group bacterium]|nr:hypothetical protein [Patescibacteria group bacterium]
MWETFIAAPAKKKAGAGYNELDRELLFKYCEEITGDGDVPLIRRCLTAKGKLRVNRALARRVFDALLAALEQKAFPYNFAQVPHLDENFPKGMTLGGVEEARFLFVVCLWMRGGIKSTTAFKQLARVWEARANIFDPRYVAARKNSKKLVREISELLQACGLKYRSGMAYAPYEWVSNLTKLEYYWHGDPRQLFYGEGATWEDAYARIISTYSGNGGKFDPDSPNGFLGFREKMASMLGFFLADRGLLDSESFPIPVDFHVMRVIVECGIIELPDSWTGYESDWRQLAQLIRGLTQQYCEKEERDWRRLGDALWLLSGNVCNLYPGNTSVVGEYNARQTSVDSRELMWTPMLSIKYWQTCGQCPIEQFCKHCVPSALYYRQGRLDIRGKHTKPQGLFSEIDAG